MGLPATKMMGYEDTEPKVSTPPDVRLANLGDAEAVNLEARLECIRLLQAGEEAGIFHKYDISDERTRRIH